jgi:hypothetical protein
MAASGEIQQPPTGRFPWPPSLGARSRSVPLPEQLALIADALLFWARGPGPVQPLRY